eukprot:TRINITY_DN7218_c0_g1_i1.p1 TRINITY_DN7218_c0_g1~~TRINITY_DN7218_c0_g1_i1.p1  ORF type:complete len:298 (+),score=28.66 TRINITY_DN7218_c0_g1_i1:90-983(+)
MAHGHAEFFDELPKDGLSDTEVILRDALLEAVLSMPPGRSFPLEDWIRQRIGGEFKIFQGGSGSSEIQLRRQLEVRGSQRQEKLSADKGSFFAKLPKDRFTQQEVRLRDGIYDFLALWKYDDRLPTLNHLVGDGTLQKVRFAALGKRPLNEWIGRRIGSEIELVGPGHRAEVQLTAEGQEAVQSRFELLREANLGKLDFPEGPPIFLAEPGSSSKALNQARRRGKEVCADFVRGCCPMGEACTLFHPSLPNDGLCRKFVNQGFCERGDDCLYRHVREEDADGLHVGEESDQKRRKAC